MIKRLVEEVGSDSVDRRLADLFRAAEPFARDAFRSRRVWVRLERASTRKARVRPWLRPAAIVTLLISGTAAAAFGRRHIATDYVVPIATSPRAIVDETVTRSHSSRTPSPNRLSLPGAAALPAVEIPGQPEAVASGDPHTVRGQTRVETSEDATRVVEAIQALRTARDPARARALLNDYLKINPRGALSAEALALSIEAASAQHDPRAAEYARRYLNSYPRGKYRELARRALEAQR